MTASVGPGFLNVPLDVLVNRDLDKGGRDILETLQKASAATSMTASAEMLLEPASKKAKLQSEPPVDSAEAALMRAGRKKPPWTTTEQAIVAIKHCELGNRWTQIAAYLPMRSENDVKNIWHSTLRCKDTQKRSFLRTYALAVHDHAYDYATRKSMFDMAVRQCGQPPPQAMETIARIQAYLDNPELQAAQQQQQEQQQQQLQHHQHQEQLAKLTHLLQHQKHGDIPHHQLAQLLAHNNLLLLQEPSDAVETTDDHPRSLSEGAGPVQAPSRGTALDASKDLDARRPRSARDKYHGKYGTDLYGDMQQQRLGAEDSVTTDTMTLLPSGSVQLPSNQVAAALRSQFEHSAANTEHHWGHSDGGISAVRRFGGAAKHGSGGYPVASADLSASLAQMAAAVAADSMSNAALQAAVAAGGAPGDLPIPHRPPGMPLPAINNILAMAFRSFYDPSLNSRQGMVNGGWVGEDDVDDGSAAPTMSALYSPENLAAAAAAVGATTTTTTTTTVAASEGEERQGKVAMNGSGGMQPQPLALRPLALRPLAAKRDRDGKDEGEGPSSVNEIVGSDSPRRGGSTARGAAGKRLNGQATAPPAPENNTGAPSPGLRTRNTMSYPYAGVDNADEMGAVEALASARSGRTGAVGSVMAGNGGAGRPSLTNIGPTVSGGNGAGNGGGRAGPGGGGGRLSANGEPGSLVSIRTGAGLNPCPRGTAGNNGIATGTAQGGPVLDLQPPRPATAPPSQPPQPQPQQQQPQQQQAQQTAPPPQQKQAPQQQTQPQSQQPQPQPQPQPPPQPQAQPQATPQPQQHQQAVQQQQQAAPRQYSSRPASDQPPQHGGPHPPQGPLRPQPQQQMQHQRSAAATLDVVSVLNMPGLRRQVLALPAETLYALLQSPNFGSDTEASVFVLVAMWLQANVSTVTEVQIQRVCSCIRLAALGGFYLSAVLPKLVLTEKGLGPKMNALRPGGKWFDIPMEELHFLTRYATAGSAERALLADVARGTYDCTSHWYDTSSRMVGRPAEGFCFEWSIPTKDLRYALLNGSQPHATFTVKDDIADNDGSGATGDDDAGVIVSVPYVLCRGLEWHVFVDCQPRGGGAAAAGVFVDCRVPSCLRPNNGGSGVVGVVPGAGIRLGVHGWRCNRLEEVFVWTFGDETFFVPDAGMGCPSALPLRKRHASPSIGASGGNTGRPAGNPDDMAWTDYLHDGSLRGTLSFIPP